ncbi:hypothetical protein HK098_003742, partial [Nowakowskiella sp. JEL0407]
MSITNSNDRLASIEGDIQVGYVEKNKRIEWSKIHKIDVDSIIKNSSTSSESDLQLEELYPLLTTYSIRPDEYEKLKVEDLVQLFRVSQLVMELKNMYLEQAESQIQMLESQLESREPSTTHSQIENLKQDITDLEKRNEKLVGELAKTEVQLEAEKKKSSAYIMQLQTEKGKTTTFSSTIQKLQSEIKDLEVQVSVQKDRVKEKGLEEDGVRNMLKGKNSEINQYLSDIELLTTQNKLLEDEVEVLAQELEATVLELE